MRDRPALDAFLAGVDKLLIELGIVSDLDSDDAGNSPLDPPLGLVTSLPLVLTHPPLQTPADAS